MCVWFAHVCIAAAAVLSAKLVPCHPDPLYCQIKKPKPELQEILE